MTNGNPQIFSGTLHKSEAGAAVVEEDVWI